MQDPFLQNHLLLSTYEKKNCRGNNSQQKSKNINFDLLDYLGLIKLCSKLGSRSKACIIFQIITLNDKLSILTSQTPAHSYLMTKPSPGHMNFKLNIVKKLSC